MTFKQIREIRAKNEGLILNRDYTHMFTNSEWASQWKIKYMNEWDMKDLIKYLDENNLNYFFGRQGIYIQ